MAKTWATKCCPGTYKNNYQLCCGIKVFQKIGQFIIQRCVWYSKYNLIYFQGLIETHINMFEN
ncbi:hypothetical protein POZ06_19545, partial [Bacteroides uniformis]